MNPNTKKRHFRCPYGTSRVYLSLTIAVLSIVLAFSILGHEERNLIWLVCYFIFTFVITATTLALKSYLPSIKALNPYEGNCSEPEKSAQRWKALIALFCIFAAFLMLPLLLARVLPPHIWFIGLISLTSGVSIAEVAFYYIYGRS